MGRRSNAQLVNRGVGGMQGPIVNAFGEGAQLGKYSAKTRTKIGKQGQAQGRSNAAHAIKEARKSKTPSAKAFVLGARVGAGHHQRRHPAGSPAGGRFMGK